MIYGISWKTRGTVAREIFDIIAENLNMDKWGNFVLMNLILGMRLSK